MDVVIYQKAIANLIGNKVGFTFEETDYKTLVIFGDVKKPTEDEIKVEYDKENFLYTSITFPTKPTE